MSEPFIRDDISVGEVNLTLRVYQDGTNTLVDVIHTNDHGIEEVLAQGDARRKKGDPRNNKLGEALAVQRALTKLLVAQGVEVQRLLA